MQVISEDLGLQLEKVELTSLGRAKKVWLGLGLRFRVRLWLS